MAKQHGVRANARTEELIAQLTPRLAAADSSKAARLSPGVARPGSDAKPGAHSPHSSATQRSPACARAEIPSPRASVPVAAAAAVAPELTKSKSLLQSPGFARRRSSAGALAFAADASKPLFSLGATAAAVPPALGVAEDDDSDEALDAHLPSIIDARRRARAVRRRCAARRVARSRASRTALSLTRPAPRIGPPCARASRRCAVEVIRGKVAARTEASRTHRASRANERRTKSDKLRSVRPTMPKLFVPGVTTGSGAPKVVSRCPGTHLPALPAHGHTSASNPSACAHAAPQSGTPACASHRHNYAAGASAGGTAGGGARPSARVHTLEHSPFVPLRSEKKLTVRGRGGAAHGARARRAALRASARLGRAVRPSCPAVHFPSCSDRLLPADRCACAASLTQEPVGFNFCIGADVLRDGQRAPAQPRPKALRIAEKRRKEAEAKAAEKARKAEEVRRRVAEHRLEFAAATGPGAGSRSNAPAPADVPKAKALAPTLTNQLQYPDERAGKVAAPPPRAGVKQAASHEALRKQKVDRFVIGAKARRNAKLMAARENL